MSDLPAILGGNKTFPKDISFTVPSLPTWKSIAPKLEEMYASGWLTKGPYLREFEQLMEKHLKVPHVVAVSSCTSGLLLAIQSLKLDKAKGEIIVPSFSFMATFHSLLWNGLTPVFVDCEPDTFTVDVNEVANAITPNTVGVMGCCIFGNPPDYSALEALCQKKKLPLFFDSAHGLGTLYHGRPLGGHGKFEVFSLSPTKLLPAGEGGLVATDDAYIAEFVRAGRDYGNPGTYDCPTAGLNARMSEFHAILGAEGVQYLDSYAEHRNLVVSDFFCQIGQIPGITFQKIRDNSRSSYKEFGLVIDPQKFGMSRDVLAQALKSEGIPSRFYFCPPGHLLSVYKTAQTKVLPVTEHLSNNIICLPIESHMEIHQVHDICHALQRIHQNASAIKAEN